MALFTEGAVTVGDGLPRGAEGSRFRRLLGHPCLSVLHPTWSVSNWDHGGCQNMKQKILVLTGTILLCGAWAVAQSGAGHAGGSTGTTGGQSTMGTQSQTPGTRPQTTTPGSAMPGASANPNGTNTPGATQPGTMPSVAPHTPTTAPRTPNAAPTVPSAAPNTPTAAPNTPT